MIGYRLNDVSKERRAVSDRHPQVARPLYGLNAMWEPARNRLLRPNSHAFHGFPDPKSRSSAPLWRQMSLVQAKNLTPLTGQNGMRLGPFAWSLEHLRINVSLHPGRQGP